MYLENYYKITSFDLIKNFVNELYEKFAEENKEIFLYHKLLEKTNENNDQEILKHLDAFKKFCN
jgi:hypothetical protein